MRSFPEMTKFFPNFQPSKTSKFFKIMAKGNLFLGMGRGKVGDVVFYRMNGLQMSRVRNRTPKNPRSNEQLYQRAIIASVMKAYSAGKEIFDHAFQGYTVGEGCMRRFNSVNARILRSALFDDINTIHAIGEAKGRFVPPRALCATPIVGLQVSEGTLTNTLFLPKYTGLLADYVTPSSTITGVKSYLEALGVTAGDIFTFVYMCSDLSYPTYIYPWDDTPYANQYQTKFGWMRFIVKDNLTDDLKLGAATYSQIFNIETGGELVLRFGVDTIFNQGQTFPISLSYNQYGGTMACIRSRNDIDLRSTEYMLPFHSLEFGITSAFVLTAWQDEVMKIGESELILEGGGTGSGVSGETGGAGGGSDEGPGGEVIPGRAAGVVASTNENVITNSPQNMRGPRRTARHKGSINETEG